MVEEDPKVVEATDQGAVEIMDDEDDWDTFCQVKIVKSNFRVNK